MLLSLNFIDNNQNAENISGQAILQIFIWNKFKYLIQLVSHEDYNKIGFDYEIKYYTS